MVGDHVLLTTVRDKSILVLQIQEKSRQSICSENHGVELTKRQGYRVIIALENTDVLKNETLQRVLHELNLVCVTVKNDAYLLIAA